MGSAACSWVRTSLAFLNAFFGSTFVALPSAPFSEGAWFFDSFLYPLFLPCHTSKYIKKEEAGL